MPTRGVELTTRASEASIRSRLNDVDVIDAIHAPLSSGDPIDGNHVVAHRIPPLQLSGISFAWMK